MTVKSGTTLALSCDDISHQGHGGTIRGNVTVYPDGLLYAEVTPADIDGKITFEYEDEEDRKRMEDVLQDSGITCTGVVYKQHKHTADLDETVIEPESSSQKCIEPSTKISTCKTCGKEIKREKLAPTGHDYYVVSTDEATCTTGAKQHIRCTRCSYYNSTQKTARWTSPVTAARRR